MRIAIAASAAATAGLIAAGMLGVATAEAPTSTPPRTVSVEGVATEAIDQSATATAATAVYRQGMTDAVSDGLAKAQFLAGKVGATLGAAQSVVEGGVHQLRGGCRIPGRTARFRLAGYRDTAIGRERPGGSPCGCPGGRTAGEQASQGSQDPGREKGQRVDVLTVDAGLALLRTELNRPPAASPRGRALVIAGQYRLICNVVNGARVELEPWVARFPT